jgi:FkbM family methyltransferase
VLGGAGVDDGGRFDYVSRMFGYAEIATAVRRVLRRSVHLDLLRFDHRYHPVARRMRLLASRGVDLVFDVGANTGQYADELRELGFRGRIVSFEPQAAAAALLAEACRGDPLRSSHHLALGERTGMATLRLAANSTSSSLLDMLPAHLDTAPESRPAGTEQVPIDTLDNVAGRELRPGERLLLKVDAQGYERKILEGGPDTLARAAGVQLELSLVPLYAGAPLLGEMLAYMSERGFVLMALEPVHCDRQSGQLLQIDGLFFRA